MAKITTQGLEYERASTLEETLIRITEAAQKAGASSLPMAIQMAAQEAQYFTTWPDDIPAGSIGWYGIDLDGTLSYFDEYISEAHIGEPVPAMAQRVRELLAEGKDVRIFTARVDGGEVAIAMGNPEGHKYRDVDRIRRIIQDYTEKHFGKRLPVTNRKDYGMIELWDDRARHIVTNTGKPCCGSI
ncbi:hypothetical protein [Noviherbaspirillum malthae]|uniref:hypothetical protein n=1 Tax=Noviherbaspirillum malthae TaxID=1260987 RepID=UPI00188FDB4C|nr:hypothetical protein [Noviherbaspirillum malthae]